MSEEARGPFLGTFISFVLTVDSLILSVVALVQSKPLDMVLLPLVLAIAAAGSTWLFGRWYVAAMQASEAAEREWFRIAIASAQPKDTVDGSA